VINIIINSTKVDCKEDQTILEAAGTAGIEIPTICFHERLTPPGLCRQCVVEVEGARILLPSCITKVKEDENLIEGADEKVSCRY
jgi:NADH dehydrogenase/NADH:ubiquinone oxidoreductase subunit G